MRFDIVRPVREVLLGGAILVVALTTARATTRLVDPAALSAADHPQVQVLQAGDHGLLLRFDLPALAHEQAPAGGTMSDILAIPGGGIEGEEGTPAIPVFTRLVAIPARSAVTVYATVEDETEIPGMQLAPIPSDAEGKEQLRDPAAYAQIGFGEALPAEAGAPALLRDMRVVPLTFRPVRYDPATGAVRVAGRLTVELRFDGEDPRNMATAPARSLPRSFDRLARELVVNYPAADKAGAVSDGTWLLICANTQSVLDRLQPLIEWRRRMGFPVKVATLSETGTNHDQIHTYIQNAYNSWAVPPEYVVLAGDAAGDYSVPTWYETISGYNGEGDHPYTLLQGNDQLSDVHIGRLSFNTLPELETIVAKIVGYESDPYTTDSFWFRRACLAGDPSGSGYSCVQVMQWIKTQLRQVGYGPIDTVFSGNFVSQIQQSLNQGATLFSYRGYLGMSGWTNSNTYTLQNSRRTPFAVISTCGTGSFAGETAISEGFLRAGTPANPIGAIAANATATWGTHTRFNNCFVIGVMQGLLNEGMYTVGAAETRGRVELFLNYGASPQSAYVAVFSHWNNLMGDPATACWTSLPTALAVTHPDTLAVGTSTVTVSVMDGATPCAGARVCIYRAAPLFGGSEVLAAGETDAAGTCELASSFMSAGPAFLTVSARDRRPYLAALPVVDRPAFVGWQETAVDDDGSGESSGNGDGTANPGESIELRVRVRNFGSQAAAGVTGALSTDDPYAVISDADESFGDIAAGQSAWTTDDFGFTVAPGCPEGHLLRFHLQIQSGGHSWPATLVVVVHAPAFQATSTTVVDGGNGVLDAGESANFSVTLRNSGGADALGVSGVLRSQSPWVTVLDSLGAFGSIPMQGQGSSSVDLFRLRADASVFPGHVARFSLLTQSPGPAVDTLSVSLTVGQRAGTDPVGPDAAGYFAFDDTDVAYPLRPAYQWVELDPALGGDGVEVVLGDYGTYQDKTTTVSLPFPFRFYGEERDHVSICSNGWLALTPTYLTDYRNWSIPGAGAPDDLVAVFWDDLRQDAASRAFTRYDEAGHRWIVEWSRFRNSEDSSLETFEAILFDPVWHPTDTGNGMILFQYHDVANVDPVDGYATAGIQNFDHTGGLLYTYFNSYPAGAAPLVAGRAVLFVSLREGPRGSIAGTVGNATAGGTPLAGAQIALLPGGRVFLSGADGAYGGDAAAGAYEIVASFPGFSSDTVQAAIPAGEAIALDFALSDNAGPQISGVTQPGHRLASAGSLPVSAEVSDPSGVASVFLYWRSDMGAWASQPMTGAAGLYSGSLPAFVAGTRVDYYVQAQDGVGLISTDPPGAPDLHHILLVTEIGYAVDGESGGPGWLLGMSGDAATAGIWVLADPIGRTYGGSLIQPEDDHTPAPGVQCFVTGNTGPGPDQEADVDGGCTTLRSALLDLGTATHAWLTYWRWYGQYGSTMDDEFAVDASGDGGSTWEPVERVMGNANQWRSTAVDLADLVPMTSQVAVRFRACDLGTPAIVEAAVDDLVLEVFRPAVSGAPSGEQTAAAARLFAAKPNPSSGETSLRYALRDPGPVLLTVHDVGGRKVRTLVDGPCAAGEHAVRWDGRDDQGHPVAAGIYLYNISAPGYRAQEKLLLLH